MKNILLFAFIFCTHIIVAQDFTVTPNPVTFFEVESAEEIRLDAVFKNTSAVEMSFTWERTIVSEVNNDTTWFCAPDLCFVPWVSTESFTLAPGEEGPFQLHATFNSEDDRALNARIRVYETGNPSNFIDVIYEPAEEIVGLVEIDLSEINLYPNPTTDNFTLTNIENVKGIVIHNIIGAPVKQYLAEAGASYSISDLPTGVYIVQLNDIDGNNVGSKRVFKQ